MPQSKELLNFCEYVGNGMTHYLEEVLYVFTKN